MMVTIATIAVFVVIVSGSRISFYVCWSYFWFGLSLDTRSGTCLNDGFFENLNRLWWLGLI